MQEFLGAPKPAASWYSWSRARLIFFFFSSPFSTMMPPRSGVSAAALAALLATTPYHVDAWSSFHGSSLQLDRTSSTSSGSVARRSSGGHLTMRKQKASDRRTRRMQRGGGLLEEDAEEALGRSASSLPPRTAAAGMTSSPMDTAAWRHRRSSQSKIRNSFPRQNSAAAGSGEVINRGRGRSRKRSQLYSTLARYNNDFVSLLTAEYRAEVSWSKNTRSGIAIKTAGGIL